MLGRTQKSTIRLAREFSISSFDGILPPGEYAISEDEELIEGISWLAYRRVATFIEVPAIGRTKMSSQMLKIDHDELTAIIEDDACLQAQATLANSATHPSEQ
ncbi:hypothetical protein [Ahrensia kielensis]|uniref:hypothetical protein n=1 Tax=Ahrensia kielensis TaxID=76980 RepID=UPI00037FCC10|nr:hypothetical protein [Ahrensia kielensis]